MFNRISAKEKSKTLLRERNLHDAIGYLAILAARIGIIVMILIPVVGLFTIFFAELLFKAGMIRSSLRTNRGDKNVNALDVILAGDRLGRYTAITLWQMLFIILWCLPGFICCIIGGILIAAGFLNAVALVFGVILTIAGSVWNIYISINKSCQYYFAYHIAEDNREFAALDCIRESGCIMVDHKWELFVTKLSFLGWNIISTVYVANIFTLPYQYLTYASIYEQLINTFCGVQGNTMEWAANGQHKSVEKSVKEHSIEVISGEYVGNKFPIGDNDEIRIGRDPNRANIVTSSVNKSISGLHCSIRYSAANDRYIITDFSSNGTFINNERLIYENSVAVNSKTIVKLADGSMIFRLT